MRRALNALLPDDVWVADAHAMRDDFHARYSATARGYSYYVGTDEEAWSPFRRRTEWGVLWPLARDVLDRAAGCLAGEHSFRAYAVRGTAPPEAQAKADVRDTGLTSILSKPEAALPAAGTILTAASSVTGSGPVAWAIAVCGVAVVAVGIWYFVHRVREGK